MASSCKSRKTQLLTTSTRTVNVEDVVCATVPPVNASASPLSLVKAAAELRAQTIAADTDSAVPTPTLSSTSVKLPVQNSEHNFPTIPSPWARLRGAFTGHGSNISNAIATLVTKAMIAHSASVPKVTTPRPTVRRIVATISRS